MPDDSASLVTVARFDRLHEAQLAKAQLDDAEIPCMLAHPDLAGQPMFFDADRGGAQLKVPAHLADEARAVLDRTDAGD